jgi:hypothetical protein
LLKCGKEKKIEFWERKKKKKKSDYQGRTEEMDANEWTDLVPKDAQ